MMTGDLFVSAFFFCFRFFSLLCFCVVTFSFWISWITLRKLSLFLFPLSLSLSLLINCLALSPIAEKIEIARLG